MTTEIKIAPKNSLLFVMDKDYGESEIPESMDGKRIVATRSCIVVGTLCEVDGETYVMLTDNKISVQEISGLQKVFSGILATPQKEVNLYTVHLEPILTLSVSNTESHVEIWANHKTEPDKLCVLVIPSPI